MPSSGTTYMSASVSRPFVINAQVLGGIEVDNNGAFKALPLQSGSNSYVTGLSSSFATRSGSIIQALNYLHAKAEAGEGDVSAATTLTSGRIIKGNGSKEITIVVVIQ